MEQIHLEAAVRGGQAVAPISGEGGAHGLQPQGQAPGLAALADLGLDLVADLPVLGPHQRRGPEDARLGLIKFWPGGEGCMNAFGVDIGVAVGDVLLVEDIRQDVVHEGFGITHRGDSWKVVTGSMHPARAIPPACGGPRVARPDRDTPARDRP